MIYLELVYTSRLKSPYYLGSTNKTDVVLVRFTKIDVVEESSDYCSIEGPILVIVSATSYYFSKKAVIYLELVYTSRLKSPYYLGSTNKTDVVLVRFTKIDVVEESSDYCSIEGPILVIVSATSYYFSKKAVIYLELVYTSRLKSPYYLGSTNKTDVVLVRFTKIDVVLRKNHHTSAYGWSWTTASIYLLMKI